MIYSSINNNISIVNFILDFDVNTNIKNESGDTAVSLAYMNGHKKIVKKLIKKGAKLNKKNIKQFYKFISKLIKKGINVNH